MLLMSAVGVLHLLLFRCRLTYGSALQHQREVEDRSLSPIGNTRPLFPLARPCRLTSMQLLSTLAPLVLPTINSLRFRRRRAHRRFSLQARMARALPPLVIGNVQPSMALARRSQHITPRYNLIATTSRSHHLFHLTFPHTPRRPHGTRWLARSLRNSGTSRMSAPFLPCRLTRSPSLPLISMMRCLR